MQFTVMLGPLLLGRFIVYARGAVQFKVVPRTSPSPALFVHLCGGLHLLPCLLRPYGRYASPTHSAGSPCLPPQQITRRFERISLRTLRNCDNRGRCCPWLFPRWPCRMFLRPPVAGLFSYSVKTALRAKAISVFCFHDSRLAGPNTLGTRTEPRAWRRSLAFL